MEESENINKIKCDQCNGTGAIISTKLVNDQHGLLRDLDMKQCPKCKGHKYVDWIEDILGKEDPTISAGYFYAPYIPLVLHNNPLSNEGDVFYDSSTNKTMIFINNQWSELK